MSEEKENNSQWDFYHSRNTKPEEGLLKAQRIFQHGAGIYVSTSQRQGCIRTLAVLRTRSSHNHSNSIQIITVGSDFSPQAVRFKPIM